MLGTTRRRVLTLTFEYASIRCGGLATMVTALCDAIDKARFCPVVVLPRSGQTPPWKLRERRVLPSCEADVFEHQGSEIWLLGNDVLDDPAIYGNAATYMKKADDFGECIAEALAEMDVDVVHLHDAYGYKCLYAARLLRIPSILTIHRLHYDELHTAFAELASLHLVDAVTTVSNSYLAENPAYFGMRSPSPTHVVMNGIDTSYWAFPGGESVLAGRAERKARLLARLGFQERPTLAYIGRLDRDQKGVEVLLAAIEEHLDAAACNFLFVGEGEKALEEQVAALATRRPEQVRFLRGLCPSEEVRATFAAVDFVLLPSRYEPFGLVQVEAMAMGAIPIASDTGGLRDVMIEREHAAGFGRLFENGNAVALAGAIVEMVRLAESDPSRVDGLRLAARARTERFSARAMAAGYEAIYASLLNAKEGRASVVLV